MEQNTNPEINRLNMEASKKAADNLRGWAGLDTFKKSNGGSYLNGSTAQSLNESKNEGYTPGLKPKNAFEFGVAITVSALKNSSLYELPAGKIMLEKFDFMLGTKGVSEAFLVEGFIQELSQFSWEESGKTALENMEKILEFNRKEIEVVKVYLEEIFSLMLQLKWKTGWFQSLEIQILLLVVLKDLDLIQQ